MASDVKLFLGDCLEILPTLESESIDAFLLDLPYGTTACAWDTVIPFEPMWEQVKRLLKPRGVFVTTASQPFTSKLVMSNLEWFKYEWVWRKGKASDFVNANFRPMKEHENILVFSSADAAPGCSVKMPYNPQGLIYEQTKKVRRGSLGISRDRASQLGEYTSRGRNYPKSVLEFGNDTAVHPTQKPVALYEYFVLTYTNPGDTVCDFAMGSGTTGVACAKMGRNFIGVEIDPKYFGDAKKRIANARKQMVVPGFWGTEGSYAADTETD